MAEEEKRHVRIFRARRLDQRREILNHRREATRTEIARIAVRQGDRRTMAAVIERVDRNPALDQAVKRGPIAQRMFAHAMRHHHHGPRAFAVRPVIAGERLSIGPG